MSIMDDDGDDDDDDDDIFYVGSFSMWYIDMLGTAISWRTLP